MGEDFPAVSLAIFRNPLGVDGNDDALVTELVGRLRNEIGIFDGGGIDRDLVGTAKKKLANIGNAANAAANGYRHEAMIGRARHHIEDRIAVVRRRGDVEEAEFIRPSGVIGFRRLDRITRIDQINEVHALDDTTVFDIEAGNDAGFEGHARVSFAALIRASASAGSMRPS